MSNRLPLLFVTHGSPMLAVEPGATGPLLNQVGQKLSHYDFKAVLMISAHWYTQDSAYLTASEKPELIYDFYGFPRSLYQLTYPVAGAPAVAKQIQQTLQQHGVVTELDYTRGLDHGAWIPMRYLFPEADKPTIQLSIPWPMDTKLALKFGQSLRELREQGVLIITSGSMTHNLRDVSYGDEADQAYIAPFVNWVNQAVMDFDTTALENYRQLAPFATRAHPTEDHFLPLVIAMGASDKHEQVRQLDSGVTYHALAMDGYVFEQQQ